MKIPIALMRLQYRKLIYQEKCQFIMYDINVAKTYHDADDYMRAQDQNLQWRPKL
jgi:hypothetical protein